MDTSDAPAAGFSAGFHLWYLLAGGICCLLVVTAVTAAIVLAVRAGRRKRSR